MSNGSTETKAVCGESLLTGELGTEVRCIDGHDCSKGAAWRKGEVK